MNQSINIYCMCDLKFVVYLGGLTIGYRKEIIVRPKISQDLEINN